MVTRCVWEAMLLMRVILWMLSTRVGTLALCGRLCFSGNGKFPFVSKFADMPVERREQALKRWSKARWLFPLKITFLITKLLSHYSFYTMVCMHVVITKFFLPHTCMHVLFLHRVEIIIA
jgi:long-chain-alcohol oxidase